MAPNSTKESLNWTRNMDDALIEAFMHEYNQGHKVNGTFTSTAYENFVKELSALFGKKIDKEKVKNRWKTLKKNFSEVVDIFKGLSGFAWDPNTQLWDAEPEVWETLIASKPKAALWRTTPFPNYEKMMILYGPNRAGGDGSETANEWRKRHHSTTEEEINETINDIDNLVSRNGATLESFDTFIEFDGQDDSPGVNSASSKKKRKVAKEKYNEIKELTGAIHVMADAIKAGNEILKSQTLPMPQLSGEEIWNMLQECGCEIEKIPDIYCALMADVHKLRTVVQCPRASRLGVIMRTVFGSN